MKAFQRWRNQHTNSNEKANSTRQRTISSKGLASSSSIGYAGYTEPQDVLYPTSIDVNQPSRGALQTSLRSSNAQQGNSVTTKETNGDWKKKGVKNRQSMVDLKRNTSVNAKSEQNSLTQPGGVRLRFDSLMERKDAPSSSLQRQSNIENGKAETQNRWAGSVRSVNSPRSKGDAALPADIVSMPKISSKQNQEEKEDAPLLVVSRTDKSKVSPTINEDQPIRSPTPTFDERSNGEKSHYINVGKKKQATESKEKRDNGNARQKQPDQVTMKKKVEPTNTLSPPALDKESTLRSSRSSGGLLQTSYDTAYHTPSQRSSVSFSENQFGQTPQMDNSDTYAASSTLNTQSSAFSLRPARGRISGLFSLKNRSTPGLAGKEGSENYRQPFVSGIPLSESTIHTMPSSTSISSKPSQSRNLANELNDLAVAFEEGLLGDDEYRLLRQGVFDKMMKTGDMELPKERTIRSAQNATSTEGVSASSSEHATLETPSLTSKRSGKSNTLSLFRKSSQRSQPPNSATGALSSSKSFAGSMASFGTRNEAQKKTALQDQFSQERRARTLRSVAGISKEIDSSKQNTSSISTYDDLNGRPYGDPKSQIGSSSKSGITQFSAGGLSISSGNALVGRDYADKSSAEIEAEIAVVEAEGKRLLDSFKTLELHAVGRYDLSFEQIRQIVRTVEDMSPASTQADMRDGFIFVSSSSEENLPISPNGSNVGRTASVFSKKRQSNTSSINSIASQASRPNRSRIAQHPPSSFRGRDPHKHFTSGNSLERQKALLPSDETDETSSQNLKKELIEIHQRRADVAKKYDDRLAFLRSAMRSAKIREGLR